MAEFCIEQSTRILVLHTSSSSPLRQSGSSPHGAALAHARCARLRYRGAKKNSLQQKVATRILSSSPSSLSRFSFSSCYTPPPPPSAPPPPPPPPPSAPPFPPPPPVLPSHGLFYDFVRSLRLLCFRWVFFTE
jgi:hypothetical protein